MSVLVTGGAGYIGSHTVAELKAVDEEVVVVDHLGQGHRRAVQDTPFYEVDIRDSEELKAIMKRHNVESVVHFAANSLVGESVVDPLKYYENNVAATAKLLRTMVDAGVLRIVFSSTAAVYGEPKSVPIVETSETAPTNPYGETKLVIERMLRAAHAAYGLNSISLRYFNAAGAHPTLPIGEDHTPETHLIPLVLQTALLQRDAIQIYGTDYDTKDGTCVRDYIHVMDLASAHRLAVNRLRKEGSVCESFNLGNGRGFTVREVVDIARHVTGREIPAVEVERRSGDPAVLVASSEEAMRVLGWKPVYADLETIVDTAWNWHKENPLGFGN